MIKNVKLLKHQLDLLQSNAKIAGIYGGRGSGKSYALSWLAATILLRQEKAIIFSTNYRQLALTIIPEIKNRLEELHINYTHEKQTNTIRYKNGALHLFSYENVDSVRGLTEIKWLCLDEIALAPSDLLAIAAPCLRGNFEPKIRFMSSPRAGSSWDNWIKQGIETKTIEVYTCSMLDNTYLSKESIDIQLSAITDEFLRRQEIYGEILDATVENCILSITDFPTFSKGISQNYYCGIDFARYGNDSTCIVVRNDNEIVDVRLLQQADTFKIVSEFKQLDNQYHFQNTYLDSTGGYDIGFYDTLKNEYKLTEVNFGGKSKDETCANNRSFMYFEMVKAIQNGFYIDTKRYKDIFEALKVTSYLINSSGKKILVPKEEIKAVLGRSPDACDALSLSFYGESINSTKISSERQKTYMNILFRN